MSSHERASSDAEILAQIRELAANVSDERTRLVMQNVTDALALNPQPIPPGILKDVTDALALNPQPLPPGILRTVLEAVAVVPYEPTTETPS
jgi:hypothetical protein